MNVPSAGATRVSEAILPPDLVAAISDLESGMVVAYTTEIPDVGSGPLERRHLPIHLWAGSHRAKRRLPTTWSAVAENAAMLRVSRQRVHRIAAEDPEFPRPEAVLTAGKGVVAKRRGGLARTTGPPSRAPRRVPNDK